MLHTVYRTTNLLNGNYYFGYHKTSNPEDDYLGSGLYIQRAVAKYGAENFRKEVLFTYLDAESAFAKEAELIDVFRNDPLCQNLRQGGAGGFDYINKHGLGSTPEVRAKAAASYTLSEAGRERLQQAIRSRPTWNKGGTMPHGFGAKVSKSKLGMSRPAHVGLAVAEANKKRPRTCWVCCETAVLKIKLSELDSYLTQGWKRGRKYGHINLH